VLQAAQLFDGPPSEIQAAFRAVSIPEPTFWQQVAILEAAGVAGKEIASSQYITIREVTTSADVFGILLRAGRDAPIRSASKTEKSRNRIINVSRALRQALDADPEKHHQELYELFELPELESHLDRGILATALVQTSVSEVLLGLEARLENSPTPPAGKVASRHRHFAQTLQQWFVAHGSDTRELIVRTTENILHDEDASIEVVADPFR
jgi:hypothetical protein